MRQGRTGLQLSYCVFVIDNAFNVRHHLRQGVKLLLKKKKRSWVVKDLFLLKCVVAYLRHPNVKETLRKQRLKDDVWMCYLHTMSWICLALDIVLAPCKVGSSLSIAHRWSLTVLFSKEQNEMNKWCSYSDDKIFKEVNQLSPCHAFSFFFLSPLLSHPLVFYFKPLRMWILNVKVGTDKSSSLPRRTLLLRRLVCGPGFNSETLWHHTSHICIILYAAASSACRNWFSAAALLSLAVLARALKRQELKQSVPDGAAALDGMRELMCCCALRLVNVF